MHVILTGATGLIGSAVLDAMIRTKDITKISILSRRPVQMAEAAKDPRINVILHQDFETYDPQLLQQLAGARACVWALGISQNKVGKDEYWKITRDYAVAGARFLSQLAAPPSAGDSSSSDNKDAPQPFRFIYVSGEGATQTPGLLTPFFGQVKGQAEQELAQLAAQTGAPLRVDSVRPGFIDVRGHAAIAPYTPDEGTFRRGWTRLGYHWIGFLPNLHSPTPALAECLTQLAMGRLDGKLEGSGSFRLGSGWIVTNIGFRKMMGL
ncbi:Protein FMP52 [Escovopsis weberi]|uniref:Protein FMP52 n=1 Tax=Escovopsis weberi TaxID=150374 RepID=A0A0M8N8V2_ESCWE|nr:Protein FMP52 [Escovopsis weberi]